jgi:hypothetical protein
MLWTKDFLVDWSAKEGVIGPHGMWNLTSANFFFRGYIRDILHNESVESVADSPLRIRATTSAEPQDSLSPVWGEVQFGFEIWNAASCAHVGLRQVAVKLGQTV